MRTHIDYTRLIIDITVGNLLATLYRSWEETHILGKDNSYGADESTSDSSGAS